MNEYEYGIVKTPVKLTHGEILYGYNVYVYF